MIRLRVCQDCGTALYPAPEYCGRCLSDRLDWITGVDLPARVLSRTMVHHTNEPRFRERLPFNIGLIRFDRGPVAVCFLPALAQPGDRVDVRFNTEELLEAK